MTPTLLLTLALAPAAPLPSAHHSPARVAPAYDPLAALRDWAVANELLDPRETRYVLRRPEDLAADLALVMRRRRELADAPPLADAGRWPCKETCDANLAFNRAFREWLEAQVAWEPWRFGEISAALTETDRLYTLWDTARDSQADFYYVAVRREALKRLREMLGTRDYYLSVMPPPVPLRWFSRVD